VKFVGIGIVWLVMMAVLWLGGGALVGWLVSSIPDSALWASRLIRVVAIVLGCVITLSSLVTFFVTGLRMSNRR